MSEKFSLKDELFNPQKIHKIALEIKAVYTDFDQTDFEEKTLQKLPKLELKERIYHISDMFRVYLPNDYMDAVTILLDALPPALDPLKSDDDFGDFIYAPYGEFITTYGCNKKYLDFSLLALREITKRFSVEYAIRDFINTFPEETLEMLEECAVSDNYHERRLVSEGLRPKLPWAKKLTLDYHEPLHHLNYLYDDTTRYVTRSVANHLNDIAKVDASLVLKTLKKWQKTGKQETKEMDYIINHALRTLVKQGNEEALALLGYVKNTDIIVDQIVLKTNEVTIGEALVFDVGIQAKEDTNLMVDYIIHFRTKLGTLSQKVHKLKKISLQKNESVVLTKKHLFRANMSTRKFYEGEHMVELQINGKIYERKVFHLKSDI